jgi:hypothetical protein
VLLVLLVLVLLLLPGSSGVRCVLGASLCLAPKLLLMWAN